jgi:cytochrome c-type biogenesis protein CcmH
MIAFWFAAALISAAAAALMVHRAASAARTAGGQDPAVAVYRRQLSEIDEMADRGLLIGDERRSARAEAARRLLAAADETTAPAVRPETRGGLVLIAAAAALAPLAALGLYLVVGSPGLPDQPFARRLQAWQGAWKAGRPLAADEVVPVIQGVVDAQPKNPRAWYVLAEAQLQAGDPNAAEASLRRAIALAPGLAQLWTSLGETQMAEAGGAASPDAAQSFQTALRFDPNDGLARYGLGATKIAAGDEAGGLADWRTVESTLGGDPAAHQAIETAIATVERTHALPGAQGPVQPGEQQAFIGAMVARLAARLQDHPDDPDGWARLIRAYAVLGDKDRQAAALARAQSLFKDQPDILRRLDSAAQAPQ